MQTFGDYAGERSGAPVRAYTRVSDEEVTNRNKVYEPDHLVVNLARRTKNRLHYINLDNDSAIEELRGGPMPTEKKGVYTWQEGILVKAMREGSWIFIDELNLSELPEYINTVFDDGYSILPTGEKVVAKPAFIIGAMNPPTYEGRNMLSPALSTRMKEIWVDEVEDEELSSIADFFLTRAGVKKSREISRLISDLHIQIRDTFKPYKFTIRDLMALVDFPRSGASRRPRT